MTTIFNILQTFQQCLWMMQKEEHMKIFVRSGLTWLFYSIFGDKLRIGYCQNQYPVFSCPDQFPVLIEDQGHHFETNTLPVLFQISNLRFLSYSEVLLSKTAFIIIFRASVSLGTEIFFSFWSLHLSLKIFLFLALSWRRFKNFVSFHSYIALVL